MTVQGGDVTVTTETALTYALKMSTENDNDNAPAEGRYLFARPDLCAVFVESKGFDGTNVGAEDRKRGMVGDFGGFTVVKDNTLPAGVAVACDKNSVHFVKKMDAIKFVPGKIQQQSLCWKPYGRNDLWWRCAYTKRQ